DGGAGQGFSAAAAGRRPQRALGSSRVSSTGGLREAPVDDERFTVLADDDVARLDIAVEHAARMGIVDRVADVEEPPQELALLERTRAGIALQPLVVMEMLYRLLETVAPDKSHSVIRPAIAVGAKTVNRDDSRVLQAAGDLGLHHEPLAACRFISVSLQYVLQ